MGKKASRRRVRDDYQDHSKVRALFSKGNGKVGGWTSLDKDFTERSYTKNIKPCSDNQRLLIEALDERNLVVAVGPAGTGKTYLAIAKAVEALDAGKVSRIILSRPAVEAGESLTCAGER
jgi:phosphate starvation-inducible PhoH-like protein